MKIRAAVLNSVGASSPFVESKPLSIEELDLRDPGPGEVLIKLKAAGLCHSDLSVITGVRPRPTPMALGHEASGEVVGLGAGVLDLKVGDLVALVFVPSCGHCMMCMEGRPALCEPGAKANTEGTLLSGARRLYGFGGKPIHHHVGVSAFADHAVVSRRSCVKIEADIDPVEAALFGCAVLTGMGAVVNTAGVKAGNSTAVVGLGGVGFCAVLGALASGARHVIAVDLHESKLNQALSLGATAAFNAKDPDLLKKIQELTKGGVDFAFEFAGSVHAMESAYRMTRRGGTTVTASLPPPGDTWGLQHVNLVAEERTVKGSYVGSCIPERDIPRYVDLYLAGKLPIDKLMGERLTLEQINYGFDRLSTGEAMRDLIVF
ncbi:alcohol dehydrogenase [Limnohabitans sp. Rim8]|jgi:alcohol dehydrogenase|uniref:Alcohol dehydrogenase n=1 Tax=Limnohabitans curvus TaxID=323423 RepID=A0A315EQG6_9BURK|nr:MULTISPECIES: zinc-dependent alcohol dehydrogenase family protein [Limnohabitans]PUE57591.1 alcohol dehydrogenase [Limnohabitans sp. Rim8]PUE60146.1 alcohol dehydrogenase [Limnohabitans curvus]BDU52613.1 alcohol dehydrogenase [Limnohabitans sp. INBF002]